MLEQNVQKFITEHYKVEEYEAIGVIENKTTLFLLLIWGIFEKECFPGRKPVFIKKLQSIKNNFKNDNYYDDFRRIALSFHITYKDNTRWENPDSGILSGNNNYKLFDGIRNKKGENLSDIEIIQFRLFVASRYRNNIFHGLKQVINYEKYQKEIEECVNLLITYIRGVTI